MTQLMMYRPTLSDLPAQPALPPDYMLRPYQPGDLHPLARMLQHAFDDHDWTAARVRHELTAAPDVLATHVIEYRGLPVATGSAQAQPPASDGAGYLHWIGVDPRHRGQRLGYAVSLAVLHTLQTHGFQAALLVTDDHRLAAIAVYQQLGFVPRHTDATHAARWATIQAQLAGRSVA